MILCSRILREPIIVVDYEKTVDAEKLLQLLEIKKLFETKLIETFKINENEDKTDMDPVGKTQ